MLVLFQARLEKSSALVQFCVMHGRSILGGATKNCSSCLQSQIRRVEGIIADMGALSACVAWLGCEPLGSASRAAIAARLDRF